MKMFKSFDPNKQEKTKKKIILVLWHRFSVITLLLGQKFKDDEGNNNKMICKL